MHQKKKKKKKMMTFTSHEISRKINNSSLETENYIDQKRSMEKQMHIHSLLNNQISRYR